MDQNEILETGELHSNFESAPDVTVDINKFENEPEKSEETLSPFLEEGDVSNFEEYEFNITISNHEIKNTDNGWDLFLGGKYIGENINAGESMDSSAYFSAVEDAYEFGRGIWKSEDTENLYVAIIIRNETNTYDWHAYTLEKAKLLTEKEIEEKNPEDEKQEAVIEEVLAVNQTEEIKASEITPPLPSFTFKDFQKIVTEITGQASKVSEELLVDAPEITANEQLKNSDVPFFVDNRTDVTTEVADISFINELPAKKVETAPDSDLLIEEGLAAFTKTQSSEEFQQAESGISIKTPEVIQITEQIESVSPSIVQEEYIAAELTIESTTPTIEFVPTAPLASEQEVTLEQEVSSIEQDDYLEKIPEQKTSAPVENTVIPSLKPEAISVFESFDEQISNLEIVSNRVESSPIIQDFVIKTAEQQPTAVIETKAVGLSSVETKPDAPFMPDNAPLVEKNVFNNFNEVSRIETGIAIAQSIETEKAAPMQEFTEAINTQINLKDIALRAETARKISDSTGISLIIENPSYNRSPEQQKTGRANITSIASLSAQTDQSTSVSEAVTTIAA